MMPPSSNAADHRLALITFDWLPAWMLSTWGATWLATPAFDRLAARGVTLDAVMTPGEALEATLEAVVGRACRALGKPGLPASVLVTDTETVARSPLATGFATVLEEPAGPTRQCGAEVDDTALWHLFSTAAEAAADADPGWLWCHAGSLGVAWDAPLDFRDCLATEEDPEPPRLAEIPSLCVSADEDPDLILGVRQAFAGQVMLADRMLGGLLDAIESSGQPWSVVVAGVRGMPLGLHRQLGLPAAGEPGLLPYGDLVQMPVILADAAGRMAGQRYGGLLAADDLGAFLHESATGEAAASRLAGLLERWACQPREQVVSQTRRGLSVATAEWRLVLERPTDDGAGEVGEPCPALFAKPDDFFEQCDVADRCPQVVDDLLAQLTDAEKRQNASENL